MLAITHSFHPFSFLLQFPFFAGCSLHSQPPPLLPSLPGGRFDTIVAENGYKAYMRLKIKNIQAEDFMSYGCYAKNSFGETNGNVKVYGECLQGGGGGK